MRLKTLLEHFPCLALLAATLYCDAQEKTPPVSVSVNLLQDQGNLPPIWEFFGYDEANYTYMRDGRKLLTELAGLSPVRVNVSGTNYVTGKKGAPIDFISFHAKGSPKLIDSVVWMNMGNQLRSIDGIHIKAKLYYHT